MVLVKRASILACHALCLLAASVACAAAKDASTARLVIPAVRSAPQRPITVDDVIRLRQVDSLSVAPDGRRFAIFVRQADPRTNDFRTAWYVGDVRTGNLILAGEGGVVRPRILPNGQEEGEVKGGESKWSPDGSAFAYTLRRDAEVQLWISRADGSTQRQVTHNPADVRNFSWSRDGKLLYFSTGLTRNQQQAQQQLKFRQGYEFDEDLTSFTDLFQREIQAPPSQPEVVWQVSLADRSERRQDQLSPRPSQAPMDENWMADGSERISVGCSSQECTSSVHGRWWSEDQKRLLFWRTEGMNDLDHVFYAWSPDDDKVMPLFRTHDMLRLCAAAEHDRVLCVRETPDRAAHLVTVDLLTRRLAVVADLNPEIGNVQLGRVEHFEWQTPIFAWNEAGGELAGLYGSRTCGYIFYPPDFDPSRKYPVFIDPYGIGGFEANIGPEHPLHVYAAAGFVVLSLSFPMPSAAVMDRLGGAAMHQLYSADLGYPHLSMLAASTLRGLDTVIERGFLDVSKIGIGGVSHGTFVPLYIVQQRDRFAAVSISSPHWGPIQYYLPTRKGRRAESSANAGGYVEWVVKPEGAGAKFWSQIDLADHVQAIEAPILMNLADRETVALLRLIRNMDEAGKPYQAYVFPQEGHIKWQPAHLDTIMRRNVDWFRFWLQDHEDPEPEKRSQYERWRELRRLDARSETRAETR